MSQLDVFEIAFLRSRGWKRKKIQWDAGYRASLLWVSPRGKPYYWPREALRGARRSNRLTKRITEVTP